MLQYIGNWERIDTRLSKQFSYSRSFFHHIISRWGVRINNKTIKKSYQLKNNDTIEIDKISRYLSAIIMEEAPKITIPVLWEKEDYLVINKPKWILSHPKTVRDIHEPSVTGFLYHTYKTLPTIGNFIRSWILHRLDKNTNGLMIIAKTEKWLEHFKKLFEQKSAIYAKNTPTQLSENNLDWSKKTSNYWKYKTDTTVPLRKFYKATCKITPEGKTFIEWIQTFPYIIEKIVKAKLPHTTPKVWITKIINIQYTDHQKTTCQLELEILTWRTHQIRYHLSSYGLPIIGDYLYGDPNTKDSMQLTAYKLTFTDPNNEEVNIEI